MNIFFIRTTEMDCAILAFEAKFMPKKITKISYTNLNKHPKCFEMVLLL